MNYFIDLKSLEKIFLVLNRKVSVFGLLNKKKISIANFYISTKIKNE